MSSPTPARGCRISTFHTTHTSPYFRRVQQAHNTYKIASIIIWDQYTIDQILDSHYVPGKNGIVWRLFVFAAQAIRMADADDLTHPAVTDLHNGYSISHVCTLNKLDRDALITNLAWLVIRAADKVEAKCIDLEMMYKLMAYNNRGKGLSIDTSISRLAREAVDEKGKGESEIAQKLYESLGFWPRAYKELVDSTAKLHKDAFPERYTWSSK